MDDGHRALVIKVSGETLYGDISTCHHMHEHAFVAHSNTLARETACKSAVRNRCKVSGKGILSGRIYFIKVFVSRWVITEAVLPRADGKVLSISRFVVKPFLAVSTWYMRPRELSESYTLNDDQCDLVISKTTFKQTLYVGDILYALSRGVKRNGKIE